MGQGKRDDVLSDLGLDAKGIADAVMQALRGREGERAVGGGLYVSTS